MSIKKKTKNPFEISTDNAEGSAYEKETETLIESNTTRKKNYNNRCRNDHNVKTTLMRKISVILREAMGNDITNAKKEIEVINEKSSKVVVFLLC